MAVRDGFVPEVYAGSRIVANAAGLALVEAHVVVRAWWKDRLGAPECEPGEPGCGRGGSIPGFEPDRLQSCFASPPRGQPLQSSVVAPGYSSDCVLGDFQEQLWAPWANSPEKSPGPNM